MEKGMYKYESMALIIKDYLSSLNTPIAQLTALDARKLPGMDQYASNSCYDNVARAMDHVGNTYFKGHALNEEKRGSSTFTYEYHLK